MISLIEKFRISGDILPPRGDYKNNVLKMAADWMAIKNKDIAKIECDRMQQGTKDRNCQKGLTKNLQGEVFNF